MRKIKYMIGAYARFLIFILAADLLYIYYMGCWYDTYKWIEISEVVMLYAACIASILWTVFYFWSLRGVLRK